MKRLTTTIMAIVAGVMLAANGAMLCEGESAAGTVDLTPGHDAAACGDFCYNYSAPTNCNVRTGGGRSGI